MSISSRDAKIINKLLDLSRQLDNGLRCRHFACLTKGKKIISLAHNQPISDAYHYRWSKNHLRAFRHAETACIKQAQYRDDLDQMTLYVVRADLNGESALSKPCVDCAQAVKNANIPRIVYTIKNGIKSEWM